MSCPEMSILLCRLIQLAYDPTAKQTPEQANLQRAEDGQHTKCNCAGGEEICACAAGKCACSDCPKSTSKPAAAA